MSSPTYILLSPVKNEERYIGETLRSVTEQTILPLAWHIIDDSSTDGTAALVKSYAEKHPFIHLHTLSGFRPDLKTTGGRSGALMNHARSLVSGTPDFIVKIDSDVAFAPDFFSSIFSEMEKDPGVGIASGHLVQDGVAEKVTDYNSNRGATRIYRYACFTQIGAYYTSRGEDAMDTFTAQQLGWKTRTFDVYFDHLKPEGARNRRLWNHFETGHYKGTIPYRLDFFAGTLIKNIGKPPLLIGSAVQLMGYIWSRFIKQRRPFKKEVCDFVREQQKQTLRKMIGLSKRSL